MGQDGTRNKASVSSATLRSLLLFNQVSCVHSNPMKTRKRFDSTILHVIRRYQSFPLKFQGVELLLQVVIRSSGSGSVFSDAINSMMGLFPRTST